VAYCPANVPPGIDFSNNPLLQGRLFSYLDTQLLRLGSPNFHQIPVNAPKCPFANFQRDGKMQMAQPKGRVNYEPNSLSDDGPRETPTGFRSANAEENGERGRIRAESFADHYSQARQFYRSQTEWEQAHLASALVFELSKVDHEHVRLRLISQLRNIDDTLAQRVADGLALEQLPDAFKAALEPQDMPESPALQIIGKMKDTLQGRAVGILVADGSDAKAVAKIRKAVEAEGAQVKIVAPKVGGAKMADGSLLKADGQLQGTPSVMFDAVAIVLSDEGCQMLLGESAAIDYAHNAFVHLKAIAADEGAQPLLDKAGVVKDDGVVDASDTAGFIKAAKARQWDREKSVRILA
jgi:catalase